jgi:hypothetical protein
MIIIKETEGHPNASTSDKYDWVMSKFNCTELTSVKRIEIVLDVANQEVCPLDSETIKTCFILRGMKKNGFNH